MDQWIRGAPIPPPDPVPVYDIVAPDQGETIPVVVLSTHVLAVETVWTKDPITGRYQCRPWKKGMAWPAKEWQPRRQWIGFVGVWRPDRKVRQILRLGPMSASDLVKYARPETGLRGICLLIGRGAGRTSWRLTYERNGDPPRDLPAAPPLGRSIGMTMGGAHIDEGEVITPHELLGEGWVMPEGGGH